ncbi:MAG: coproporphyrinogen dehydrogenase HemZ [Lachnospiraceae bacterium]|nr:coproporphyrinogen dehydrogenase HemZ [Lachnospiraceae bacterium]
MMKIYSNSNAFEYDIQNLVKSFYPQENVRLVYDENEKDTAFSVLFSDDKITFADATNAFSESVAISVNAQRGEVKNILKRLIYKTLSKYLDKELAWGDLSGIRPTKIAMKKLEEGASEEETVNFMKETYLASDEKSRLSVSIASLERKILKPLHYKDGYSLYIGIPFCPTTCMYCSFTSYSIARFSNKVADYLSALEKELSFVSNHFKDKILDTIYIGGGTPTTLSADELERLLSFVCSKFDLSHLIEFTVEAGRADSITLDKLKVLKKYNVTRISVNPQTMNQKTLDIIGRRHTVEDVKRAFYEAREAGHDNINMDIILGLPEEGIDEVRRTVEGIKELGPDSFTVHSLAIKRASRMQEWIDKCGYKTMINTDETMKMAKDCAYDMGMQAYYLYRQKNMAGNFENTGYAKENAYGIYNILIMEEMQTIVACGAGTVTKRVFSDGSAKRCDTHKDVDLYISMIDDMIERKRKLFE